MSLFFLLNPKFFGAPPPTPSHGSGGAGDEAFNPEVYRKTVESRNFQTPEKTRLEVIREISQDPPQEKPQAPEKTKKKRRYVEPEVEFRRRPRRARPQVERDSGDQNKKADFASYGIPEPSARDVERAARAQERQRLLALEDRRRELIEKQAQAEWMAAEAEKAYQHRQRLIKDDEELVTIVAALIAKKRVK